MLYKLLQIFVQHHHIKAYVICYINVSIASLYTIMVDMISTFFAVMPSIVSMSLFYSNGDEIKRKGVGSGLHLTSGCTGCPERSAIIALTGP